MVGALGAGSFLFKKTTLLVTVKSILTFIIVVYAVSITSTTHTYQGLTGGSIEVTNNLGAVDKGFAVEPVNSSASATCPTGNVTFAPSAGIANTLIVANDFVYDVQVSTTASTAPNSCFTATLILAPAGGPPIIYGPVFIATGASITPGQMIDCKFDVGTSLPLSSFSFKVTVQ